MKVETAYDVGHTFYVPRCYCVEDELVSVHAGETWTRKVVRHEAVVKHKVITRITAEIDGPMPGQIALTYYVTDVGSTRTLPSRYGETEITSMTFDEARAIAVEHAANGVELYK